MPETGNPLALLFQGMAWFGSAAGLALIYGWWDRWAKQRKDSHDFQTEDEKIFEAQRDKFLKDLTAERDHAYQRARTLEDDCERCQRDKDRMWRAARALEEYGWKKRHRIMNILQAVRAIMSPDQWEKLPDKGETLAEVPSLATLIAADSKP